jgi:hypothetical protein
MGLIIKFLILFLNIVVSFAIIDMVVINLPKGNSFRLWWEREFGKDEE